MFINIFCTSRSFETMESLVFVVTQCVCIGV
jgi:hypothetical protein